jgi:hypothetical protein
MLSPRSKTSSKLTLFHPFAGPHGGIGIHPEELLTGKIYGKTMETTLNIYRNLWEMDDMVYIYDVYIYIIYILLFYSSLRSIDVNGVSSTNFLSCFFYTGINMGVTLPLVINRGSGKSSSAVLFVPQGTAGCV